MHIFDELQERGLIFQTTDEEALRKALEEGQVSYYTGYDNSGQSSLRSLGGYFDQPPLTVSWSQTLRPRRWCNRFNWRPIL